MSFSRSEVEKMIDKAVLEAGIGREERYEAALYKLEDHIKKVKRRGEAAFAYIRKLGISTAQAGKQDKSQLPSSSVAVKLGKHSRSDSDDETVNMEVVEKKHGKNIDDKGELLKKLAKTKKSVESMQADAEVIKNHIRKVKEEPLSPTKQPSASDTLHSLQSKVGQSSMHDWIKKESVSPGHSPSHEKMQVEDEEQSKPLRSHSVCTPEDTESQMDEGNYPPFPPTPFPNLLNSKAASYNIPQAPTIQVARIKHPPGLSVLWNITKEDPSAPPMDLYSVYMTVEDAKGSGVFKDWKSLGEVKARELPMCVLVSKYRPEYKVCFTVVGKDIFGRYGTYSKVATATPPAP